MCNMPSRGEIPRYRRMACLFARGKWCWRQSEPIVRPTALRYGGGDYLWRRNCLYHLTKPHARAFGQLAPLELGASARGKGIAATLSCNALTTSTVSLAPFCAVLIHHHDLLRSSRPPGAAGATGNVFAPAPLAAVAARRQAGFGPASAALWRIAQAAVPAAAHLRQRRRRHRDARARRGAVAQRRAGRPARAASSSQGT